MSKLGNAFPYDREDGDAREDMYSSEANVDTAFPSFSHLLPNDSKGKGQHKQIKLTLLNKVSLMFIYILTLTSIYLFTFKL